MSVFFFEQLGGINHLAGAPDDERIPAEVLGRALVVRKLNMVPVECVARGYLTGSGLADYQRTGAVCGVELPAGLVEASKLPEPIFTPATKAVLGEHDENIDFAAVIDSSVQELAIKLREDTLDIYFRAASFARGPGHHPRRHQVRVRPRRRRQPGARRRGAHPGLVPLLARRRLRAGPGAAELRQAVRPQLAHRPGVRLGPGVATRPRRRCRRRSSTPPGPATSRPTSASPGCPSTTGSDPV